jgi:hypothetical protein
VREVIVVEELEHGLRCFNGRDLPMELYMARAWANKIARDWAAEAERLSRQLVWVANILIDLGLPSIEDNPKLPKTDQDALATVALILERLLKRLSPFFSLPIEATVGENMVIYTYMFIMEGA